MRKFYQLSHNNGQDAKVVLASTKYEAIGFYLSEEVEHIGSESLDKVKTLPPEHEVQVPVNGFLVNNTIEAIWKEKDNWIYPKIVVHLN